MNEIIEFFENIKIFHVCSLFDIIRCLLIIAIFFIARGPLTYIVVKLLNLKEKDKEKIKKSALYKPLRAFFLAFSIYLGLRVIDFNDNIKLGIDKTFRIIVILLIAKVLTNMMSKDSKAMRNFQRKLHIPNSSNIVKMVSKVIAGIIYAFAIVIIINELGYDVNGLVAGLGLGGLTVALAAQDVASNIFAGMVILFDKPWTYALIGI